MRDNIQYQAFIIIIIFIKPYVSFFTRDIKTILTPDGPSPARLHGLPKIDKALVNVFQIIDQLYLKLALRHIKVQSIYQIS